VDLGVKVTLKLVVKILVVAIAVFFLLGFALGYEDGRGSRTTGTPAPLLHTLAVGDRIEAGIWRVAVLSVEESLCVKLGYQYLRVWEYYQAPKGMKVVVVRVLVENRGSEDVDPFSAFSVGELPDPGKFGLPILVTSTGKRYKATIELTVRLVLTRVYAPDEEILKCAIPIKIPDLISASKRSERNFIYLVPENEKPVKLVMVYQPTLNRPPTTFEVSIRHG
jgi:hypothetical protein